MLRLKVTMIRHSKLNSYLLRLFRVAFRVATRRSEWQRRGWKKQGRVELDRETGLHRAIYHLFLPFLPPHRVCVCCAVQFIARALLINKTIKFDG